MLEKELFCRIEIEHGSVLFLIVFIILIGSRYIRPPDNGIKDGDVEAEEDNSPNNIVDLFDDLSRG